MFFRINLQDGYQILHGPNKAANEYTNEVNTRLTCEQEFMNASNMFLRATYSRVHPIHVPSPSLMHCRLEMKVESLFQMMKSMVSLYGIASSAIHCIVLGM